VARLRQIDDLVAEVCRAVQSGQARLDLDPGRLQLVSDRIDEIHRALRRFGPGEDEFRAQLLAVQQELTAMEGLEADPAAMTAELQRLTAAAAALGQKLLRARQQASAPFAAAIQRELGDLGMPDTQLRVVMAAPQGELLDVATDHGPAPVDLEVCINPGEPFHSLRATASGGELARIVLAVKKTLADQDRVPLLVLDEIDAEIGGRLGLQVGHKLGEVSRHHQVVIVTHLPQVAAFAQRHFLVEKTVQGRGKAERTRSTARLLGGKEVERELAAMAMGDGDDAAALRQARTLVQRAKGEAG
jgi:DNA repair protein RecN (Recombination protein N)